MINHGIFSDPMTRDESSKSLGSSKVTLPSLTPRGQFFQKRMYQSYLLDLTKVERDTGTQHVLKLCGLPLSCYTKDLIDIDTKLKAKTIHVPRDRKSTRL